MGIRFCCHHCQFELHVKDFQKGKRGKCPQCSGKFRIPASDSDFSLAIDEAIDGSDKNDTTEQIPTDRPVETAEAVLALANSAEIKHSAETTENDMAVDPQIHFPPSMPANVQPSSNSLAALRESPNALWHVRPPSGGQYGPASGEIFFQWIVERRVTGESLVWREGWPEWLVAANVFQEYFGPTQTPTSAEKISEKNAHQGSSILAARQLQKKRANKRYTLIIGVLATLAVILVVALVLVVLLAPAGTSQPAL